MWGWGSFIMCKLTADKGDTFDIYKKTGGRGELPGPGAGGGGHAFPQTDLAVVAA